MSDIPLIEMKGITKEFPGVRALDKADFELRKGEIHALVGENGAGKSTLMRVLFGVYKPEEGQIFVKGQETTILSPSHAQKLGISMVHQELLLVPSMNSAQNIALGREIQSIPGILNWRSIYKNAEENLARVGVEIDTAIPIKSLSIAQQQMVEIAKSLSWNAEVIALDEPTSALSPHEVSQLFKLLKNLAKQGVGIIFITHRIEEIFEIADRVTVFRDGHNISTWPINEVDIGKIITAMVGRQSDFISHDKSSTVKKEILRVEGLVNHKLAGVSFRAYEGEIVGLAGLVGAGRTELARAIFGADPITKGKIYYKGNLVKIKSPQDAVSYGIGLLPEDRKTQGLVLPASMESNLALVSYDKLSKYFIIKLKNRQNLAKDFVQSLKIKPAQIDKIVQFLSGGNQQKVVLGKWLARQVDLYIFDEPTRGIDVGSKAEIHQLMADLANKGACLIMISSEQAEILKMSDRILVMHDGKIVAELDRREATQELIMEYAAGIKKPMEVT